MVYERMCGCVPEPEPDDAMTLFYARLSQVSIAEPDGDCIYA